MKFRFFREHLKGIAIAKALFDLVSIPVNLFSARMLADIVLSATSGDTNTVLSSGLKLAALLIGYKIFETLCRIRLERRRSKALHKCKLELYENFLSRPLWELYSSDNGQLKERLTDDFSVAADKIMSVYPGICVGILTGATYLIFVARLSWMISIILTLLALIQIVPPIMVKKYFEKNYKDTREIEAQLTNSIIEAHHSFAILKLYDLKSWYIKKLKKLHSAYSKIGNIGIYTNTAENVLNDFVSMALKYGTYAVVGLLALKSIVSLNTGVEAIALSGSFYAAVNTIFASITRIAVIREAETRLSDWFVKERGDEKKEIGGAGVALTKVLISYDDKAVLDRTSIAFPTNGICLIKGANGAGKSTLFKLITGLIHADQGAVRVGGIAPDAFSDGTFPWKLFYLPQEDADLTLCPRDFYKMIYGENLSSVIRFARSFGLRDRQLNETNINALSGGERKKVFLALALAVAPTVLLLDEPTNSLDETSKNILILELKKREGLTLIITHDSAFDSVCSHLFFIRERKIENEEK